MCILVFHYRGREENEQKWVTEGLINLNDPTKLS